MFKCCWYQGKECESNKLCIDCVLDRIKNEISDLDDVDYDFEGYYKGISDALEIIDKYKIRKVGEGYE